MNPPKAFISYSHDSAQHKAWTLKLATDLRALGVDVVLDQWDLVPGQDVSLFMQRGIAESDRVVMVCSSEYVRKAEAGAGGVGYERLIVTEEIVRSIDTIKFIPIVRSNGGARKVPIFMGPRLYVDFENDAEHAAKLDDLARAIHGAPATSKPPIGPNPFSGTPPAAAPSRYLSPTGALSSEDRFLDSDWFGEEQAKARGGIKKLNLTGHMELRIGIQLRFSKSQIELLNAVRQSEVKTFGWPIGITLENREEYRPRPYGDGIRAEVSIDDGNASNDRRSYDYWAFRANGDFFLLQSLFEDTRVSNRIFFDTRMVRVTESLMFAEALYTRLGAPPEARIGVRVSHSGLSGRELTAASQLRYVSPKRTAEDQSVTEIVTSLGSMKESRVENVKRLLAPMFMLFDFQEFADQVYEDIVRSFEQGIIR